MKKSFMTRALATGLSLAMAFSLTAATNVTSASAAAKKPKLVTYAGASAKSLDVKVGETVKVKVNAATKKNYKISAVKVSGGKSAKIAAKKNKAGTVVAITGKTATSEGKPASVKVSFKAKKTGKTSKYSYVSKVTVTEDKLTMTAAATKVKKLTVTFNKAVDTTTTKLAVKKGAATPTITSTTFAADAKSAEIVMGTKLTEGVYTVEATVGEEKLTADVTVQDEKLTKFELVGNNLVATPTSKAAATISFKALNQYDEMMAADSISNPTCSFGKATLNNAPTADKAGKITVSEIPDVLAVEGQTGTLVFVDSQTGVTANETVTYRSKAVAAKATVYGIYDTKKDKLVEGNLKVGDTIANYKILMNIQNQYESDMTPDDIKVSDCEVSFNPASVLTDVDLYGSKINKTATDFNSLDELTYDGKSCMLIPLKVKNGTKILEAGSLNLTIVSANKGVLATPSFKIDDAVMIQSFSVSPKTTVYGGQDNELVVDATDINGKAVTSYTDLKAAVETQGLPAGVTLKKNSDGSGTFWYNPGSIAGSKNDKWKKSELKTLVFKVNAPASGNYLVKTANVTAYANRLGWKVSGVTSDTTTATATKKDLVFKLKTLTYEDQYSTAVKYADKDQLDPTKISAYLDDSKGIFGNKTGAVTFTPDKDGNLQFTLKGGANKGNATLYLRYMNASDADVASADKYDLKVTLSVMDVDSLVASDLTMKINDGNAIYGVGPAKLAIAEENKTATVTKGAVDAVNVTVVVTGTINGKTVVIPAGKCTIVDGASLGDYGVVSSTNPAKTEEKTVTVVVESSEGPQTITGKVTVSSVDPAAKTIKAATKKDISVTSGTAITATKLGATVDVKDQYGASMSKANDIRYKVTFTGKNAPDYQKEPYIVYNETQRVEINLPVGEYTATVEYKLSDEVKFEQDIKITVTK